ncbi:MAG: hypothetical protein IT165_16145 [Bryobacterales bacterium]|nr:hypothetical protein [Bryobacterales bacterium]
MFLSATLLLASTLCAGSYTVTTVAGADPIRDGGQAMRAILTNLTALALDARGNLYLSDGAAHRIRRVPIDSTQPFVEIRYAYSPISTFAGAGAPYFSGDGGPAAEAHLSSPGFLAFDPHGNLFLADRANFRIRKITPEGIITTIAGTGRPGEGDEGIPALRSPLGLLSGIALSPSGEIFFCEANPAGDARLRRISSDGTVTTLAGGFLFPGGLALDPSGNLFLADTGHHTIRKLSPDGKLATIAGAGTPGFSGDLGPAAESQLASPRDVALDAQGNLYIADTANRRVRRVTKDGIIDTLFPQLGPPQALAVDPSGNVFIAYPQQMNIWAPGYTSIGAPVAGDQVRRSRPGIPATDFLLLDPSSVAAKSTGSLYITQPNANQVQIVRPDGILETLPLNGLNQPTAVTVDAQDRVLLTDTLNNRILEIPSEGPPLTIAEDTLPRWLSAGPSGNLFFTAPREIRALTPSGISSTLATLTNPITLAAAPDGPVFTVANGQLRQISPDGAVSPIETPFRVNGVAVDPRGSLVLTTLGAVYFLHSTGEFELIAGGDIPGFSDGGDALSARFSNPESAWVDPSGAIYIVDRGNHRIRKLTPNEPNPASSGVIQHSRPVLFQKPR